jgi:hypothetical protein
MDRVEADWDLEGFYLNQRRLSQLMGVDSFTAAFGGRFANLPKNLVVHAELAAGTEILKEWLRVTEDVKTIEEVILKRSARVGMLFTAHRDFYGKGIKAARKGTGSPLIHATYRGLQSVNDVKLNVWLHNSHLAPGSPEDYLSGHAGNVFVIGSIQRVSQTIIETAPIFIGRRVDRRDGITFPISWKNSEITIDQIDSFSKVRKERTAQSFAPMKNIPEVDVKKAIRSIIGEPYDQKDWGGETSDLFTNRLIVEGQRVATAFVLKGPSRWGTMTLAHLGKNGDQICRLASEPADLLVVQHCCQVHGGVRIMLRAFCNQISTHRRRFCIIDGCDTVRLLRAYGKCGLQPLGPAN